MGLEPTWLAGRKNRLTTLFFVIGGTYALFTGTDVTPIITDLATLILGSEATAEQIAFATKVAGVLFALWGPALRGLSRCMSDSALAVRGVVRSGLPGKSDPSCSTC